MKKAYKTLAISRHSSQKFLLSFVFAILFCILSSSSVFAQITTVIITDNSETSLEAAIVAVNANPLGGVIDFNLPLGQEEITLITPVSYTHLRAHETGR